MKSFAKCLAALALCAALVFGMSACSNGSDSQLLIIPGGTSGGVKKQSSPVQNGEEQNKTPIAYDLIIDDGIVNGTVTASTTGANPASKAKSGETVTLVMIANAGYELDTISVIADNGDAPQLSDLNVYTKTFVMPNQAVRVRAAFKALPAGKHSVTPPTNVDGGSVTSNAASAAPGETVTIEATPDEGMRLASWEVKDAAGNTIDVTETESGATFVMPEGNVTINATFDKIDYTITINASSNGTVTADKATANYGDTITLTIESADGYELSTLTVTAEGGASVAVGETGDSRTFTMPAKNVTVTAAFLAINYNINMGTFANGTVETDKTTANCGVTITLTVKPDTGYVLQTLAYTMQDGSAISIGESGNTRSFTMPASNVTVSATFAVLPPVASGVYTPIGTETINGVDYELVTFGLWPQTIKDNSVDVSDQCESKNVGDYTYYKGNDGQWYAKIQESAYESGYTYSDGSPVAQSSATSEKWFKVEPIKWRVLTTNYGGKKLLLAENILISRKFGIVFTNYNGNNYSGSGIRKWLNSNTGYDAVSDHGALDGFLKTAFTAAEIDSIADTRVDNSQITANPDANSKLWNNGRNDYASKTPTTDKVFLLSEQEVTKNAYGFAAYDAPAAGNKRIRKTTDYAKASGVCQSTADGEGGYWWLRSPRDDNNFAERCITYTGWAYYDHRVDNANVGIVPALCVE